jgi:hypothetical protein
MDIYPARDSCGLAGDIKVKEIEPNIIGVIPGLPAFSRLNPLFLCAMNAAGMIPVIIMVVNYLSYCGVYKQESAKRCKLCLSLKPRHAAILLVLL